MKVLLINPNTIQPPVVPLGLLSLAASVRKESHELQFLDLCFDSPQVFAKRIREVIQAMEPDVIGIGVRNLDNGLGYTYFDNITLYYRTISLCQEYSSAKIVLGGGGFSIVPKHFIERYPECIGIVGEGESSFILLLRALEAESNILDIPNLVWFQNERMYQTKQCPVKNLESLPTPALDLVDVGRYLRKGGGINLQTKRGCPFKCVYCSYPLIESQCVRLKSPLDVVAEFRHLKDLGAEYVHIVDSVFNYPESHAIAICEELRRQGLTDIGWDAYFTPAFFSRTLARRLKEANCQGVIFGTDSADQHMLRIYQKPFGQSDIIKATENCQIYGLDFAHHILFGGHDESKESVNNTLKLMQAQQCRVLLDIGIQVYEGTKLAQILNYSEDAFSNLSPPVYVCPDISGWIEEKVQKFCEENPLFRTYIGDLSIDPYTNPKVVEAYEQGGRGPYWKILDSIPKKER